MSAQAVESPVIPEWTLGDRLRKIRRVTGMSQAAFAEHLGENQKTYAAWELDTSAPRNVVAVAKKIELISGVPAPWILGLSYERSDSEMVSPKYLGDNSSALTTYPQLRLVPEYAATAVPPSGADQPAELRVSA